MSADKTDKTPAKPGKETIYVDVDDEITGIIDKVEAAKQKVVALVLPKRATMLQSIVNMRLLKRSADNAGKNVVLITSEEALLPLAGAAELHVAKNLQSKPEIPAGPNLINPSSAAPSPVAAVASNPESDEAEDGDENLPTKISYDKSIGELAADHEIEHPETIELGDDEDPVEAAAASTEKLPKAPKDKSLKVPNFDKFRLFIGLGIAGLIALIVFIFLAIKVLPKATINVTTTSTPVSANFSLNTSGSATSYDKDQSVLPGFSKKSSQTASQQVQATGQKNNGNKASGTVTLTNCSTDNSEINVPAGTGISSGDSTFITQSTVSLPFSGHRPDGSCDSQDGVSSGNTNVVAQSGGTKYNLPADSNFSVAGYPSVSGSNSSAFTGGTDDIQTIVSQGDVESAKQKLSSSDTDKFAKDFEDQLSSQGFYVLTSTLKQSDPSISSSPAVGEAATTATVTVKVNFTVLAIKQDDLKQAISDALSGQIDKTKQKIDDATVLKDATVEVASQSSATNATLNITENTSAIPLIDASDIRQLAQGKKSGDITSAISSIPGVKTVNVKMSPFWVSKAPNKPSKIIVNITHLKNGR